MSDQIWYQDPQWWAIFVALLLGVTGVFQDWIRGLFRNPKLELSIKKAPPDCHKAVFRVLQTGQFRSYCYYFRFKVKNKGNYQMEDVEIMVDDVREKVPHGEYQNRTDFLPMSLNWSYYRSPTMPKIQPKFFKHCDLGYLIKADDANLEQFGKTKKTNVVFMIDLVKSTFIGSHILEPGEYKIKINVGANNLKPIQKQFYLKFKDEWLDDEQEMFEKNVEIREI